MLHGREGERAVLGRLLDEARASRGGAGAAWPPGIGKSALLVDTTARAEGLQSVRIQGVESESPLVFAALHRLLRPAVRHLGRPPAPAAEAARCCSAPARPTSTSATSSRRRA